MPSPSLAPSAVSSRGSLSARPLLGRSHAWLVRKPDLVWQILTDFLGGRADGQPFAFQLQKSAAERHFCAADDDEDERTSLSGFLPPLLRSKFGSRRSTLVRVNEVGRNADKFPLLPLIRGRTNRRSLGEKGSGKKDHPSGSGRGSRAADLVSRENLAAAFFVFSLCLEFRYLAHFMPPRPGRAVPPPTRVEEEGAKRSQVNRR